MKAVYHPAMATSLNQDDYLKTALRLPRDLHAKIQEAASAAERSMNAEIVARLHQSFSPNESADPEIAQAVTAFAEIGMNMVRSMSEDEFKYYLDRVKRANWEKMGLPPENMPEPPPAPDLTKRKPKK